MARGIITQRSLHYSLAKRKSEKFMQLEVKNFHKANNIQRVQSVKRCINCFSLQLFVATDSYHLQCRAITTKQNSNLLRTYFTILNSGNGLQCTGKNYSLYTSFSFARYSIAIEAYPFQGHSQPWSSIQFEFVVSRPNPPTQLDLIIDAKHNYYE